jgi:BirA family biotin operon repressor/biotin-[acetyl-CoA-carboxylase] ligase
MIKMQVPIRDKKQHTPFQVEWFDEVDSTNTRLLEKIRTVPTVLAGTVLAARRQSAGRGRLDRKWLSATSGNLLFSLFVRTGADPGQLPSLTMAMAIAIDEMLHTFHVQSNLKWPNDIHVKGHKIAGLLAERAGEAGVVIGVGLNVNMTANQLAGIDQPATSLSRETGRDWLVEEVLALLLTNHFPTWLDRWERKGFPGLRERWVSGCGGLNIPLAVRDGVSRIHGTLAGFGDGGELQLRLPDGAIQTIWAGDIERL